jgi:hypothetical protein
MRRSAARWAELVGAWESSGQGARTFADEHQVSEASLRWWKGELARRARNEPVRPSPGPGRRRDEEVTLARVLRASMVKPSTASGTRSQVVVAVGHARILVGPDFDAQLLVAVVRALGEQA